MHYRFESIWALDAPTRDVYMLLLNPGDTTSTSMVKSRVLDSGGPDGRGRRAEYRIRSPLLYSIRLTAEVVEVDPPTRLQSVVDGDLAGTGTYHLSAEGEFTRVRFDWNVRTTKGWMNLLGPIGKPLFVWAHDRVMDELIRAMAHHLDATLLWSESRLVSSGRGGNGDA